jgi:proteic killer suppression protein
MIQSFGDRDTELLFHRERIKRLPPDIQQRARKKLLIIHAATDENDLIIPPGNRFEKLKGDLKGWCSIRINEQWRVIFKWAEGNAREVTITDYH